MSIDRLENKPQVSVQDRIARTVTSAIGWENALYLSEISQWLPRPSVGILVRGIVGGAVAWTGGVVIENFSGRTSIIKAAQCEVGVQSDAYNYIDMRRFNGVGKPGKIDPEDVRVSLATNIRLELREARGNKKADAQRPFTVGPNEKGEQVSRAKATLKAECNEKGINEEPAVGIWKSIADGTLETEATPDDIEYKVIPNGLTLTAIDGREVTAVEAIRRFAENMPKSDPRREQILKGLEDPAIVKEIEEKAEENRRKMAGTAVSTQTRTGSSSATPTARVTTTPRSSSSPTVSVTPSSGATPTEAVPTATRAASVSATPRPSQTPKPGPSVEPSPQASPSAESSPEASVSPEASPSPAARKPDVTPTPEAGFLAAFSTSTGEFLGDVLDLPAMILDTTGNKTEAPVRYGVDAAGWLATLALLFDRPRTRLARARLNRPRTRVWNMILRGPREIGYRWANRNVTPRPPRNFAGFGSA